MNDETIACILDKNVRFLHSGQMAKYIFPMAREEAHQKEISHLIIRFFLITFTPNGKILYLVELF